MISIKFRWPFKILIVYTHVCRIFFSLNFYIYKQKKKKNVHSKTVDDCETDGNECNMHGNECDTDENCLKQNLMGTQNKILKSVYGHG